MVVSIGIKTYYSIQHVQAAAYFARRAMAVEDALASQVGHGQMMLKAYVSSVLFSSVAFLEALANELLADSAFQGGGHLNELSERDRSVIAQLGETESVQRAAVLAKFDLMLCAAGKPAFEKGRTPYQEISTLVRLRNEIVHYKAPFFDAGSEDMVRPGSFNESKLPSKIEGLFEPQRGKKNLYGESWLGAGCALWAVKKSVEYADAFFAIVGVEPYYHHVREQLSPHFDDADASQIGSMDQWGQTGLVSGAEE